MKIHYIKHVPFEGIGSMDSWFQARGYCLHRTCLYQDKRFPDLNEFDGLIVMGGPMGVNDELQYSWLASEKQFIKAAIDAEKKVLGICLGAQLIAQAMGAKVYKNKYREIGWFPLQLSEQANQTVLKDVFPIQTDVFHWHGDTFDIPDNAIPIASSQACANQGFIFDDRVIGFQFHLETTSESARSLINNCGSELDGSTFVQTAEEILSPIKKYEQINAIMTKVLERLFL